MNTIRIAHSHTSSKATTKATSVAKGREVVVTNPPRHVMIDAAAARRFLAGTARLLEYAAESSDSRELLAGLDLIRKTPSMLSRLEVRS